MALKGPQQKKRKHLKKKDTSKKDTFNLTCPISTDHIGSTILNKQNTEIVAERKLKGRCFDVFQQDLSFNSATPRRLNFIISKINGKECKSHFNQLEISTDKLRGIVKKWYTLIETNTEIVTKEGIKLRIFCIGTSARNKASKVKKHSYLKPSVTKQVRKSLSDTVQAQLSNLPINELVKHVLTDKIDRAMEDEANGIAPVTNCLVRKIKVVKRPREVMEQ